MVVWEAGGQEDGTTGQKKLLGVMNMSIVVRVSQVQTCPNLSNCTLEICAIMCQLYLNKAV